MSRDLQSANTTPPALIVLWCVFAFSLFVHLGSTRILQVRVEWIDALWFVCALCMAWLVRRHIRDLPTVILLGAAGFLLAASLSLLATPGWGHLLKYLGYCALTISALLCWVWTRTHTQLVAGTLRWLLLVAVLTTLAGWLLALGGVEGWGARRFQGAFYFPLNRATGLTNHPDRAALVLLILYGLFLMRWRPRHRRSDELLVWATPWAGLITLAPFSPLLFAQLGAALMVNAQKPTTRGLALCLIVGATSATLLLSFVVPLRDPDGAWQLRGAPRTLIQAATITKLDRSPWLGQGLATKGSPIFSTGYPPITFPKPADPHNAYLDLLVTGGILMLLGFVGLLWSLTRPPDPLWRGMVLIYLACGLVHSINDERMLFFGLGVGAALATVRVRDDRVSPV